MQLLTGSFLYLRNIVTDFTVRFCPDISSCREKSIVGFIMAASMKYLSLYFWLALCFPLVILAQWTQTNGPFGGRITGFAVSGPNHFAGTEGGGVYLSTDSGTSWTVVNAGLMNTNVQSLVVIGTNLFAGTNGAGVWRRPLTEMITSVERMSDQLPEGYALHRNYPNPFNPSTTIAFSLPHTGFVTLKVFNTLGQEVATLVSQELSAGYYETSFDAAGLGSGIYFYRLTAGAFTEIKQMVLMK